MFFELVRLGFYWLDCNPIILWYLLHAGCVFCFVGSDAGLFWFVGCLMANYFGGL